MSFERKTKEDFAYLEVYLPVSGLDPFLDKVQAIGDQENIFGKQVTGKLATPAIIEDAEGQVQPVMTTTDVETTRLNVYRNGMLRLNLLDRRASPERNFARSFNSANGLIIRRAVENNEEGDEFDPAHSSLGYALEVIADRYGLADKTENRIISRALGITVDHYLDQAGTELTLQLDPAQKVTRMLVDQADLCMRALARRSPKSAEPFTAGVQLSLPFARMPSDAPDYQKERFIQAVQEELPQEFYVGMFRNAVGGASWTKRH